MMLPPGPQRHYILNFKKREKQNPAFKIKSYRLSSHTRNELDKNPNNLLFFLHLEDPAAVQNLLQPSVQILVLISSSAVISVIALTLQ